MAFEMLDAHWLAMRGSKMEFNVQPSNCLSYHVDCSIVVLATHNVPNCEINGIKVFFFLAYNCGINLVFASCVESNMHPTK